MTRVRVLVWYRAPGDDPAAVESAYHRISAELNGTPGLLGNELLRAVGEPGRFAVLSEWAALEAFRRWESGPTHKHATAPLLPFLDRGPERSYALYEVAATH